MTATIRTSDQKTSERNSEHGGLAQVQPPGFAERLPHRVERAGADVAVGHAERSEREAPQAARGVLPMFHDSARRRGRHPLLPRIPRTVRARVQPIFYQHPGALPAPVPLAV